MKTKIIFLFLFPLLISAQSGKSFLSKLQEKYKSIKNFTADFTQEVSPAPHNKTFTTKGKFYYEQKNKYIIEFQNQTVTSDGDTVWNYNKKNNRVIISSITDESASFSIDRVIYDYPSICDVKVEKGTGKDTSFTVINLTPKDEDAPFKYVKVWADKNYLVGKFEIRAMSDAVLTFVLSNIKLNKDFSKMKFVFYPPKGAKIIDLR